MDVTVYRWAEKEALRWKDLVASLGEFQGHLLRRNEKEWGVYDARGTLVGDCNSDFDGNTVTEVNQPVSVDHQLLIDDVRDLLMNPDLTLMAAAEWHVGASSADHSNMGVMCRRLFLEAESADLAHVFIVESRRWPCRVTGIVGDLTRMSGKMSDTYFDRRQWLINSWPLLDRHHTEVFADRLARITPSKFSDLISRACEFAGLSKETAVTLRAAWHAAGPSARYNGARRVVELLRDGIVFIPRAAEEFSEEILRKHGRAVVEILKVELA